MIKTLLSFIGLSGSSPLGLSLVGLTIAGAFAGGMITMHRFNQADMAEAYAAKNQQLRDAVQRTIDQAEARQAENDAVVATAVQAERSAAADYTATIKGLHDAKPDDCTDRPFPAERRRLLNLATTGTASPAAELPAAAGPPAGTPQAAAAPVTYGDQVDYAAACGRAYRELVGRYGALIDWHQHQQAGPDDR